MKYFGNLSSIATATWFLFCLLVLLQSGCSEASATNSDLDYLQGNWEGHGPPGNISLTITGDSLHFFARTDFWYSATIVLPEDTKPKKMQATITDSSPPAKDIGEVVFAVFKFEDGALTLAVVADSAATTAFADDKNNYVFKKVTGQ